jgi:phospholipid transport system substrate-binding protein
MTLSTSSTSSSLAAALRCAAFAFLGLALFAAPARAADAPRDVVAGAMGEILAVLKNKEMSSADRLAKIETIAYVHFDFESMSRLVLAKNYNSLNDTQRKGFEEEFKKHISLTYGRRVENYSNESIETGDAREERNKDVTVQTKILGGNANGVRLDYRMRQKDGNWQVIDVIIEGVSLVSNFRSQIQEIISSKGTDKLIELLHEKNMARAAEMQKS